MRKPNFGVVVGVVVVLAAIGFVSKPALNLIPAGRENRLRTETSDFLLQASHHEIDWRPLTSDVFADARKKDKPVMLVVGSTCSATGRAMDKGVFTSKEVRGYLSRYFICARVDSMSRPEWANAFLPLTRALPQGNLRLGIPAEFQIWFLDPSGRLLGFAAETVSGVSLDPRNFVAELRAEIDRFTRLKGSAGDAARAQAQDLAYLEAAPFQDAPDFAACLAGLSSTSSDHGGFPVNGFQKLWPYAWEFQVVSRDYAHFKSSIEPCLDSRAVDLLDGGFFTDPFDITWTYGGYDKVAALNAGMLRTLSLSAALTGQANHRWLAIRTFDSLAGEFVHDGVISSGRVGDEDAALRSTRSSFSPKQLRELFPAEEDREWMRSNLGLRVEDNPQMVPRLASEAVRDSAPDRLLGLLSRLRSGRTQPDYAGDGLLDSAATCVARMIESARLLGDRDRLSVATGLFDNLDPFRSFDDVSHSRTDGPHAYLGDYLAYADAALQDYLATGDQEALRNGVAVLRRGLFLFKGSVPGEYVLSQKSDSALGPQSTTVPEIVDNLHESCSAQVLRLSSAYGRVLGSRGVDLVTIAHDTERRFAPFAMALNQFCGGYLSAAALNRDPSWILVVGSDSAEKANSLARHLPLKLIAPSLDASIGGRTKPGIYIVADGSPAGPFSEQEVLARLAASAR